MRSCVSTNGKTAPKAHRWRCVVVISAKSSCRCLASSHSKPSRVDGTNNHSSHKLTGVPRLLTMLGLVAARHKADQHLSDALIRKLSDIFPLATLMGIYYAQMHCSAYHWTGPSRIGEPI